ncbi:MAG: hypothetical protein N2316_08435 [Spirochaetes bacterium]|nr:hypothetical protein [Spirochaetota bacterium]
MRKKRIIVWLSVLALIFVSQRLLLFSQQIDERPAFRVQIFMDRYAYDGDGPIKLHIRVFNSAFRQEFFKVADVDYVTFQPIVYGPDGKEAQILVAHRLKKTKKEEVLKNIVPRSIILARNESFTYTVDLKKLYHIEKLGEYRVRAYFLPHPEQDFAIPSENVVRFKLVRPVDYASSSLYGPIREKRVDPSRFSLSPREVVLLFLTAEKEKRWEDYFKYVKLESFIQSFPDFGKLYNVSDDVEKLKVEQDFITFIKKGREDYITGFRVGQESIIEGSRIAYVESTVSRYGTKFGFQYNYKYTLEKFDSLWLITGVEATIRKGKSYD